MALPRQKIMIPVVRAYGFLSFNHFEDIERAINMDKNNRRGWLVGCVEA